MVDYQTNLILLWQPTAIFVVKPYKLVVEELNSPKKLIRMH